MLGWATASDRLARPGSLGKAAHSWEEEMTGHKTTEHVSKWPPKVLSSVAGAMTGSAQGGGGDHESWILVSGL